MKKIISMVLALVMVMGLSVTAMAAESPVVIKDLSKNSNTTIDIPAYYDETKKPTKNEQVTTKNYVYMEWKVQSTLKYVIDSSSYTWNVYSDVTGNTVIPAGDSKNTKPKSAGYSVKGHWDETTSATINVTVENWSNRDVWVKYTLDGAKAATADKTTGKVTGVTEDIKFTDVPALPGTTQLVTKANVNSTALVTEANKSELKNFVITGANIASGAINSDVTSIGTLTVTISNEAPAAGN